jgi:YbbR domain-containing protein
LDLNKLLAKITENWPAKVLSLALAIIIFLFHRMNVLENRVFSASLGIESGNMAAASSYPRTVRVKVRGEKDSIGSILEEDIEVYLDLKRFSEEGTHRVPLQFRKMGTALGIDPLEITIDPPEIVLDLEKRETGQGAER